jgi:hypothetical protein
MVGEILFSQGGTGATSSDQTIQDMMGVRSTRTAADGTFSVVGTTEKGGSIMADHADRGRSDAIPLAPGKDHVTDVQLQLRGFGSVAGKVTMEGRPVGNAQVMSTSKTSTGHVVVVVSGGDGTFVIDKLPAGEHRLSATKMENFKMTSANANITVQEGKRTEVVIDIPVGAVTLTVEVKGKSATNKPDAAQVFLFRGAIAARNAKDITDRFLAGDAAGMGFWMGGTQFPEFDKLVPASYTVCTLPINGNLADQQFGQRLQENMEHLLVYCTAVTVTEQPSQQKYLSVVPAMKPLPEE